MLHRDITDELGIAKIVNNFIFANLGKLNYFGKSTVTLIMLANSCIDFHSLLPNGIL